MLEGRLLTGDQREYQHAPWDGQNRSGCFPLDDKVLVLMDDHVEQTSGGVYLAEDYRQRQSLASETGVVVALGEAAFTFNDDGNRRWFGTKPEPGDRVYCERYAGREVQGQDGRTYRIMSQRCIAAIVRLEGSEPLAQRAVLSASELVGPAEPPGT